MALIRRQLFGQRVALDRVDGRLRQRQVGGEIGQIAAVVLPHEEKLLRVADDGGADTALPLCMSTPKMSVEAFCRIFVASCPLTHEGYTSMSECLTSYAALTTTKPNRQQCQAYHLCQAVDYPAGDDNRANHCGHATGFVGNQACEQDD